MLVESKNNYASC